MSVADDLQRKLEAATLPFEAGVARRVALHRALREPDVDYLRAYTQWDRKRRYVPDPLPGQIATAHADLLFGDEPSVTAAAAADQARLDELVDETNLPSELHRAAEIASSEGEVWWRIYTDRDASDYPLIQWCSRLDVAPLWRAGRPVAVAFISVVDAADQVVTRHVEIQAPGETRNLLYRGSWDRLGVRVSLDAHPDTEGLPDEWLHAPLMLAGRVLNRPRTDTTRIGRSDYHGAEELMLALNEATTIGAENARLTAKKRLFVDGAYLDARGNLPAGDDVYRKDKDGDELGDAGGVGVKEAEYSYDAAPLIAHTQDLVERIVTRCGLVPQWVGVQEQGRAESGTALRVRLLPATLTAHGKSRFWTDALPRILGLLQMVDAMPEALGGFGRDWARAADDPDVALGDPIPPDALEDTQRAVALVDSGLQSRETTIRELHPDWGDEQVAAELDRIRGEETQRSAAVADLFGNGAHDAAGGASTDQTAGAAR